MLLLTAGVAATALSDTRSADVPEEPDSPVVVSIGDMEALHGVRIDGVKLASAGYMLDLRYWVIDADKAWALFRDSERRELIHSASGARLIVPAPAYVGPLAQSSEKPKQGRRYFMFFANPGRLVSSGDQITIRFDDLEVGPIAVR